MTYYGWPANTTVTASPTVTTTSASTTDTVWINGSSGGFSSGGYITGASTTQGWGATESYSSGSVFVGMLPAVKAQKLMLLLHPNPSFSSWAMQFWKERQNELIAWTSTNGQNSSRIMKVPKMRLYFIEYWGELLVATKSLRVANRCLQVLE